MSRKTASALVFFLAVLLTTVPAWSSMPGHINPADCGKSITTDLNAAADYTIKTEIILARGGGGNGGGGGGNGGGGGGNGGGNGGQGGNGGGFGGGEQGGHGNGHGGGVSGGHGTGDCDGTDPQGPQGPPDAAPGPGPGSGNGGLR